MGAGAHGAAATGVIGVGNGAHDNHCANSGSAHTSAVADRTAGTLGASVAAVQLSAPAKQCGDLGLPKEDKADQPVENFPVDAAE